MIAMLRRRLMSNMAKAKKIATGTVNGNGSATLTISGLGFKPDHVAIVNTSYPPIGNAGVWAVYDEIQVGLRLTGVENQGPLSSLAFTHDSVTMTSCEYKYRRPNSSVSQPVNDPFTGTYRYVAWQE